MAEPSTQDNAAAAKLKSQLASYKAITKTRPLTGEEFKQFQILNTKAKALLSPQEYGVFSNDATRNVIKPHIYNDAKVEKQGYEGAVKDIDNAILSANTKEEIDKLNAEKSTITNNYKKQEKTLNGFNEAFDLYESKISKDFKGNYSPTENAKLNKGISEEASKEVSSFSNNLLDKYVAHKTDQAKQGYTNAAQYVPENTQQKIEAGATAQQQNNPANNTGIPNNNANNGAGYSKSSSVAVSGYGGRVGNTDQKSSPIDMKFGPDGKPIYGSAINTTDPNELKRQIDEDRSKLDSLKNTSTTEQAYAPDLQNNKDIGGYLMDIGRMGLGLKGALTKTPQYQTSPMFNEYMQDAEQRKNMGLSPTEISFAKNLAERGYGYDVKNIRNLSGGSSGVALGNLGRATQQLQDQYGNIATQDQAVRRQNRQQFYNAAGAAENVNQYKFGLEYQNAMNNKQAGAALVQDAMGNIINRNQYNDTSGKGSQYYNYMKELTLGQQENTQILKDSQEQRRIEGLASLQTGLDAKQKQYNELTGNAQNLNEVPDAILGNTLNTANNTNTPVVSTGLGSTLNNVGMGSGLSNLTPDQLAQQGITKETTNIPGELPVKSGEVYSKQVGGNNAQLTPEAIKVMENNGENVYNHVKNTPEYTKEIKDTHASYDEKIQAAKNKMNAEGTSAFTRKVLNEQIATMEKEKADAIDEIEKKHSDIADKLFDENGKYIGNKK